VQPVRDFFQGLSITEMAVLFALVIAVIIAGAVIVDRANQQGEADFSIVATSPFRQISDEDFELTLTAAAPLLAATETAAAQAAQGIPTITPPPAPAP